MKALLTLVFSVFMTGSVFAECTENSLEKCTEAECKAAGFTFTGESKCVKAGSSQGVTACTGADDSPKSVSANKSDADKAKDNSGASEGATK